MSSSPIKHSLINRHAFQWFLVVGIIGIAIRLLLFFVYAPVSYNDTPSYWRSAEAVIKGFTTYDGTRTPGYPVFLALVGSEKVAYGFQLAMGFTITMIIFYLGWKLSKSVGFGALIGLAHTLNAGQVLFEANLLTETLTTFWIVLTLLIMFIWMKEPVGARVYVLIFSGIASSLAVLTRPLFIFFPVWVAIFLSILIKNEKIKLDWRPLILTLLPALFLVGGWMGWVNSRFGVFNLSTMGGYHLVQHTGNYFEYAQDEDAVLRDVYLNYRDERVATYGTQGNTIWDAIPAMQEASGLNFYDLSKELQRISIDLIKAHPSLYLKYAIKGWWLFWHSPVYWSDDALAFSGLAPLVRGSIAICRAFLFGSNILFIVSSILALFWKRLRSLWELRPMLWFMAGTIWVTSVLQTLLDHGDNPRFLVPIQSLCVFWVLWIGYHSVMAIKTKLWKADPYG